MSVETTEMTIIDLLNELDNDVEHWICSICWPGYDPDRIVETLCGVPCEDCPEGVDDNGLPVCGRCDYIKFCPMCGSDQK